MKDTSFNRRLLRGLTGIATRIPDRMFLSMVKPQVDLIKYPDARDFINLLLLNFKHRYRHLAPSVRKRFVENLFGNAMLFASEKIDAFTKTYGFIPPSLPVISPTFRCNLKCYGCYSANYAQDDVLDSDTIDRVLTEGKEYGMYFAVITGGEPFIRRDMMKMFEKHSDMIFQVYTNGVYIKKDNLVRDIVSLGNVIPCFSVEGFEEQTDARRGKGVFDTVVSLMDELRSLGGLYGYSATATRENNELIVSDEFVDFFEKRGCYVGWYFNYKIEFKFS
ncbi:MAG: radical SAM protein, partial [Deltaproteobacteria bacterium]|nr:radical SAM protein [Deltaproteobacteria bacterium]